MLIILALKLFINKFLTLSFTIKFYGKVFNDTYLNSFMKS